MPEKRPYVMSIAGYDPSGGAGVLADVKVFEQHKIYGFAIITSNTLQDDTNVKSISWIPIDEIKKQIDIILKKFTVEFLKIGIVENCSMLLEIKKHVLKKNPKTKIIWDPILASSSGFKFFNNKSSPEELLKAIYVVTPNLPEFKKLIKSEQKALNISHTTAIYLKGGHHPKNKGVDELFLNGEKIIFRPGSSEVSSKHGSGCILSSAIAANLALGKNLTEACQNAKSYTEKTLASNPGLLAYHN